MPRPLRHAVAGGYYHVTMRGNDEDPIYIDDDDRTRFIAFLGKCVHQNGWRCLAYCLMSNHYHLVVRLTSETLSRGMQWLNGLYAQSFNDRHERRGHVFGGRYRLTFVESDAHLAEACRYVVCNPVRAGICRHPHESPWSSYRATAGYESAPHFLAVSEVLSLIGAPGEDPWSAYRDYVDEAVFDLAADPKGQTPWGLTLEGNPQGSDPVKGLTL